MQADSALSRVLAVLVVHDGAQWLPRTLGALDAQDHPGLEIIAVDNDSTDDSRRLLLEHLGRTEQAKKVNAAVAFDLSTRDPQQQIRTTQVGDRLAALASG